MATKIPSASLYVGDLAPEVTETTLYEVFNVVGPVASIRVCRDSYKPHRSLGYAYVNFHNPVNADRALEIINNQPILGKPCRIMWSQRDPSLRKSGVGNIFIKNLHESIGIKELTDTFSEFGNILSCKIAYDEKNAKSKGFGFVHFEKEADAEKAIETVNEKSMKGKKVFVGHFLPKRERNKIKDQSWTNVFVKNLDPEIDEQALQEKFKQFGILGRIAIKRDENTTQSKGFGFINFEKHEDALKAVEEMHKKQVGSKEIWVGRHQKKPEREAENRRKFQILKMQRNNRAQGTNLYIKNLEDEVDDSRLRSAFESFGNIKSAKVMRDDKENSKGFGFICYTNPDEARHAIEAMNGQVITGCSKPLYVALHETKEVRRQKLIQQFAARKGNPPNQMPYQPYYANGVPQPNYVYPQPLVRQPRPPPAWGQHPGHYQYPVQVQVPNQGPGGGRVGNQRGPQSHPGRSNRNMQQRRSAPVDETHSQNLNTVLSIPEDQRKLYLGEQLYPVIYAIEPHLAGKITGMLLDSGWTVEALTGLLSDKSLLAQKVQEAKEVLERAQKAGELGEGENTPNE